MNLACTEPEPYYLYILYIQQQLQWRRDKVQIDNSTAFSIYDYWPVGLLLDNQQAVEV